MKLRIAILSLLIIAAGACSPRTKVSPSFKEHPPRRVALLAPEKLAGVREKRLKSVVDSVSSELRNSGYYILDPQLSQRSCSATDCPADFQQRYGIEALALLSLNSATTNNFLAGYYDQISGSLKMQDAQKRELASVSHSQREAGGLVLESGQVIQGIRSQFTNYGDDSFNRLAQRFARKLVSSLPRLPAAEEPADAVALSEARAEPLQNGRYRVCALGTRGATAALVSNGIRSSLRESSPGKYCGVFLLDPASSKMKDYALELRSPYGNLARSTVEIDAAPACDLASSTTLVKKGDAYGVGLSRPCPGYKVIVYRAPSPGGPYMKAAELRGDTWFDPKRIAEAVYSVIAVSSDGVSTAPVTLVQNSGK